MFRSSALVAFLAFAACASAKVAVTPSDEGSSHESIFPVRTDLGPGAGLVALAGVAIVTSLRKSRG